MELFESAFERIKILARFQTRNVEPNFEKKEENKKKTWKQNRKANETQELKITLKMEFQRKRDVKNWTEPRRESKTENYWIESYFEIVNSGF